MAHGSVLWIWLQHQWMYFAASIIPVLLTLFFCWFFWRRYKTLWQSAENERMEMQAKLNHVAQDYQEIEDQSRQDARQLQALQQEITATDKRHQESMQEIARAKRSVSNYMANIEALRLERDRLQDEVNAGRADGDLAGKDLSASREELEALKEALSESEHRNSRLGTELQLMRTIRTEFQALRQDNIDLEEELAERRQASAPLEGRIEELTIDLQEAHDDREVALRELRHLRTELAQSRHHTSSTATSAVPSAGPTEPINDDQLGLIHPGPPAQIDALTVIDGVAEGMETKLNELGVYQYSQIANWTNDHVETFSQRLGFQDRIQRDRWREQAYAMLNHTEESSEPESESSLGEEASTPESESKLAQNDSMPVVIEELGEQELKPDSKIQGFAGLPKPPQNKVAEDFADHPSLFANIPAASTNGDQDDTSEDPELGPLFAERPTDIDDLTQIKGIAKVLEKRLHEVGVYRYKQVAQWSDKHVEAFSKRLSFHDRIQRDRWREQCIDLHHEKYGEELPFPS